MTTILCEKFGTSPLYSHIPACRFILVIFRRYFAFKLPSYYQRGIRYTHFEMSTLGNTAAANVVGLYLNIDIGIRIDLRSWHVRG